MVVYSQITLIKQRLAQLRARNAEADELIERGQRLKVEVAIDIEKTEAELAAAASAPMDNGHDPTLWLPDELMILIFLVVGIEELSPSTEVCARWDRLSDDRQLNGTLRWRAYATGQQNPRTFVRISGHKIKGIAVGLNGNIYTTERDNYTIKVWSAADGILVRKLIGHSGIVRTLAIGPVGTVFSGSDDKTIRCWSSETGTPMLTWVASREGVYMVVAGQTHVFSLSSSHSIEDAGSVYMWHNGALARTLKKHTDCVTCMAVDNERNVLYSGSYDGAILVWCALTGAHFQTIKGKGTIAQLIVGISGTLFSSASNWGEGTIQEWSGASGTLIGTIQLPYQSLPKFVDEPNSCLAIAPNGALVFATMYDDQSVRIWQNSQDQTSVCIKCQENELVHLPVVSDDVVYVSECGSAYSAYAN